MTYTQDLNVRRCFGALPVTVPWKVLAESAVEEADLWTEEIRNPATFWRKRIQCWVDGLDDSEKKPATVQSAPYVPLRKRGKR
jgi:hypothetical protein